MLALSNNSMRLHSQPFARRIMRLMGFGRPWSRVHKHFDQDAFDTVGLFMKKFAINPCPVNYALVFNFAVKKEANLLEMIGELIKTGYAPDDKRLPVVVEQFEADLANLANDTQNQLTAIENLVSRTRGDASEYGSALKGASTDLETQNQIDSETLISLCEFTRLMISKTREVESELRSRSQAIEGLVGSLRVAKLNADTDALTGLSNRRAFERKLGAAFERARLGGESCILAICDIDKFKRINDSFGHQTGDRIIQSVAKSLEDNCEGKGHVFRFGGEEYVILFENISCDQAVECVELAMRDLSSRNFVQFDTKKPIGAVTFSCGLSAIGEAKDPSELLGNADRALYQAKAEGRNCIRTITAGTDN